jgi:hypothetical protein
VGSPPVEWVCKHGGYSVLVYICAVSTMSVPASTDWRTLRCVIDGRAPEGQGASHATVCVSAEGVHA